MNAQDQGWPIENGLKIEMNAPNGMIVSPEGCWNTQTYPTVQITAAFDENVKSAYLGWKTFSEGQGRVEFEVIADGVERTYAVPLNSAANYTGSIKQWGIQLSGSDNEKPRMTLRKFEIVK